MAGAAVRKQLLTLARAAMAGPHKASTPFTASGVSFCAHAAVRPQPAANLPCSSTPAISTLLSHNIIRYSTYSLPNTIPSPSTMECCAPHKTKSEMVRGFGLHRHLSDRTEGSGDEIDGSRERHKDLDQEVDEESEEALAEAARTLDVSLDSAKGDVTRVVAHARGLRISPMKLNACMKLARRRSVHDALIQCSLTPRKGAMMLKTLLQSARANAIHNFSMDPARLIVDEVFVTKGSYEKRIIQHAKGRAGFSTKKRAHLTIYLTEAEQDAAIDKVSVRRVPPLGQGTLEGSSPDEKRTFARELRHRQLSRYQRFDVE
mmetsp:Transcript_11659/g.42632  ORF Transcript_11659/g.42632 Transcript_11659/m.42632 type:complete len:318 (-) Transcript_11659:1845-2798(-)